MFRNSIALCFLLLITGGAPAFSGESVTEWNPRPRKNCSKLERLPCSIRVSGAEAHVMSVKSFEIRAGKRYRVSGSFRSAQKNVPFYMGILPLDARGESFGGSEACPVPESDTRLIADVKPGDRIMKVADASKLCGFEKVKNIFLDCEHWTIENGMLTPTMKLKRLASRTKYKEVIEALYKEGVYNPKAKWVVC